MPVIDHDVDPSTQKGADFRYGCWNHQRAEGYWASTWSWHGKAFIAHRMSLECRYDMSITDPNCTDCKHRGSGEAYAQSVREHGA